MQRLLDALGVGDEAGAQRVAHSLKGVAATLGMRRIQEQALRLELALKNGHDHAPIRIAALDLHDALTHLKGDLVASLPASEGMRVDS
jgi:two-component system, sensor histidine kinase and response regulator